METIKNFDELVQHLVNRGERKRVAVICPRDESTRKAINTPEAQQFLEVVSVDNDDPDQAASEAVAMAREGKVDLVMKGLVNTDNLLRAVLNKETASCPRVTCLPISPACRFLPTTNSSSAAM